MKPIVTLRRSLLIASFAFGTASFTQTTIFLESMGTVSGTTTIAAHVANNGFDNSATLTYTGTADVRSTTPSTGYTGASGSANVFLTNNGTASFQISGVNTLNFTNLTLSFGAYKSNNTSDLTELLVQVSTDGVNYSTLTFPAQPTGTGTAIWRLLTITGGTIPATSNLRIRWTNTSTGPQFRIDDVRLAGDPVIGAPSLSTDPSALSFGGVVVGNTATDEFEVSGSDLSPASGDITVTAPGGLDYQVSLDNSTWTSSVDIAYTGGSLSATTVYVRFAPQTPGAQNGNVTFSGGGVTSPPTVDLSATGITPQIYWNFASEVPTYNAISNLSSGNLGRGNNNGTTTLITTASPSSGYSGASGSGNAGAAVPLGGINPATSTYFSFTLTPASGYGMAINAINFGSRSTGTGPQSYEIRWSLDGYASPLAQGIMPNTSTWSLYTNDQYNWTSPVDVAVTFRIYGFDCSGSPTPNTANWRIDDLQVLGVALQPAAVWYSRGVGNSTEPIWSTTPTGTAGPALFTSTSSMVVQSGDIVSVNANTSLNDLTVETGAILDIEDERVLSVYGDQVVFDGNTSGLFNGELSLEGTDPVNMSTSGTVELTDLTIAASAGVTLTGTWNIRGTLLLGDGDFDATNATVTLTSDQTRTGRLGPVGAGASYTGDLTVQRYIPGGATNWRLLGSSVADATVADWNNDFFTAGFPGSNYPNFQVGGQPWPSIRKYDETNTGTDLNDGLVGVASTAEALVPGRGYAAWSGDNLGGTAPFTVSVTGNPTVAQSPLNLPVTWTDTSTPTVDGWNLVSNPLASPVDFSSFVLGDDMTEGYYVYDPATGNSAFWDEDSQTSTPANLLNGVLQSSQGFWLKANGTAASASLGEGAKVSGQDGGLFGGLGAPAIPGLRVRITAPNGMLDEARVLFQNGSPALDAKDGLKLNFAHNQAPRIATRSTDGVDLILNRYGAITEEVLIPVTVRTGVAGTFTLTALMETLPGLQCVVLEDLLLGTATPLVDGTTITVQLPATQQPIADRFVLRVGVPMGFDATNALCAESTGFATVDLGAATADVLWTDAQGQPLFSQPGQSGTVESPALLVGGYSVQVVTTSACGTLWQDFAIDAPAALVYEHETLDASCPNTADGTIAVGISGGTAPHSVQWNTGATGQWLLVAPGSYTALITDANGCQLASEPLVVGSGEGPSAAAWVEGMAVAGEPTVFANGTVNGEAWAWSFGDGATSAEENPVHVYTLPGTYTVTLVSYLGDCADETSFDVVVQTSTRVENTSTRIDRVWADAQGLVIDLATEGATMVEVLDATGRLHLERRLEGAYGLVRLNTTTLATGIWFVRLTRADGQRTFRVPVTR
jgi:hypothetical protein